MTRNLGRVIFGAMAMLIGLSTTPLFADSIAPATFSATLGVGGSTSITKTVTITQQATSPIDIFFLVDTTGSMGGTIGAVTSGFSSIVSSLSGIASNVAFGVGQYKDVFDAFAYSESLDLTTNTAAVQTALGGLSAGGGVDYPEANLQGLNGAATGTSWRPDSQRFVVWVGDAPGHDPSGGITESIAIASLNAANVDVYAASANSSGGLNDTGAASTEGGAAVAGQADRIVAGVGGAYLGVFSPATIVSQITNALVTGISTYSSVGLQVLGLPPGVTVTVPPAITGAFDRSITRTFTFDNVTFTGLAAGTYDFSIAAVLSGTTVVATELDHLVVGDGGPIGETPVPEPGTWTLMGLGLVGCAYLRRRGTKTA